VVTYGVNRELKLGTKVTRSCGEDDLVRVYRLPAWDDDSHIRELLNVVESGSVSVRGRLHLKGFSSAGDAVDLPLECRHVVSAIVGGVSKLRH
jgi:hypothetical protein